MKTTILLLIAAAVLLGGILFLAARADQSAAPQPVQYHQPEIPQTGILDPGGVQGNPPGIILQNPSAWIGLAASLAGALVMGLSVIALSRHKPL